MTMKLNFAEIIEQMRETFIPRDEFNLRFSPIEKIVYSMITMVLVAFMSFLISVVIKK